MILAEFKKLPVLGILRGVDIKEIPSLIDAIVLSGLKTIEITLNTQNAFDLIEEAVNVSAGRVSIGAGTVLKWKDAENAVSYGAEFIVSPVLTDETADFCRKNKIPFFPGAFSPLEVYNAWEKGASMVKVFPASVLGSSYFKEIKGPFNDIEFMAVGGINKENAKQYMESGASAIAFGASIFKRELLEKKDFGKITEEIRALIKVVKG